MRVIKQNTLRYESFYKSLPSVSGNGKGEKSYRSPFLYRGTENENEFLDELITLKNQLTQLTEIEKIAEELVLSVKKIIPSESADIFLFNESGLKLVPVISKRQDSSLSFVNKALKEGIVHWVFETDSTKGIPDTSQYKIGGSKLYYIFFPIISGGANKGILSILTSVKDLKEDSSKNKIIRLMIDLAYSKIEVIKFKNELSEAYHDQQIYQSKLVNDYKLSAIGELTHGIVEDILSPLQVIMSHVDLLRNERLRITGKSSILIKTQINKVESLLRRLVSFASSDNNSLKVQPCNINSLIDEIHKLQLSTFENKSYECHLDLFEELPLILSHPDYINQILTNIFSIINSSAGEGGGILIQTRFKNERITVRFVITAFIEAINNRYDLSQFNLRIINNIMKKHEGELKVGFNNNNGTVILLSFPLKRTIRV